MNAPDSLTLGSAVIAGVITIAAFIPKLLKSIKRDNLDTKVASTQQTLVDEMYATYEKQRGEDGERLNKMEARMESMDNLIHFQSIKITRLIIVVIHLKALLISNIIPIPDQLQDEIDFLINLDENIIDHHSHQ